MPTLFVPGADLPTPFAPRLDLPMPVAPRVVLPTSFANGVAFPMGYVSRVALPRHFLCFLRNAALPNTTETPKLQLHILRSVFGARDRSPPWYGVDRRGGAGRVGSGRITQSLLGLLERLRLGRISRPPPHGGLRRDSERALGLAAALGRTRFGAMVSIVAASAAGSTATTFTAFSSHLRANAAAALTAL